MSKERRTFDDNFKRHIVELFEAGQTKSEIARSYNLAITTVSNWVKYHQNSGSFREKDNISDEQKQIFALEKELHAKQMELDILKKAMVIMSKQ